jgi:catechol 2,3-dioxygenase-like lactoylglutathione lyase family enzyme
MISKVTHVSLLVPDQEEALAWYTEKLGFKTRSNDPFPDNPEFRWVTVAPPGQSDLEIVLPLRSGGRRGIPKAR